MNVGRAIVETGEAYARLSKMRAERWPAHGPALKGKELEAAVATLAALEAQEKPGLAAMRNLIGEQLTGMPKSYYGKGKHTLLQAIALAEPMVIKGSTVSQLAPQHYLVPKFHIKFQPASPAWAQTQVPYLHLHLLAGHELRRSPKRVFAGPWWFHYGFTCFRGHGEERSDGQVMTLAQKAHRDPEHLRRVVEQLRADDAPGLLVLVPNMSEFDTHHAVRKAADVSQWDVAAWAEGEEPGIARLIEQGSPDATRLAAMDDRDLSDAMGRFMNTCATHFMVDAWRNGHVSTDTKVFISYRHEDCSNDVALALHDQLEKAGVSAFLDVADIASGEDWNPTILRHVEEAPAFVALAGPDYFGRMSETANSKDIAEAELERVFKLGRRPHGFLLEGTAAPTVEGLPPALRALPGCHLHKVRDTDPQVAAAKVYDVLAERLDLPRAPLRDAA